MNFNKLNDKNLHEQTKLAAKKEKLATVELLEHLTEVNRRVLYADFRYSTLQKYVIKELGYSENESFIRIQAMKLIRTSEFSKEKMTEGSLTLCNAATLQIFLNDQKIVDPEKIEEIINLGINKSNRDLKAELDKKSGKVTTEKKITLKKKILDKIKRLNKLLDTEMSELEAIESALDQVIRQQELKLTADTITSQKSRVISNTTTRYIPVQVKRAVVAHANHQCEFQDKNGKRCLERRNLQFDHVQPFAMGGGRTAENVRMLCSAHNQRRKVKTFGYKNI